MKKNRAIFLDRDGTLIHNHPYLKDPDEVVFLPQSLSALEKLSRAGFRLIVITNQSGIGRGLVQLDELGRVHDHIQSEASKYQVQFDRFYFCPHLPPELNPRPCDCRKPKKKLFEDAVKEFQIDVCRSYTIGDQVTDAQAGHDVGSRTILLTSEKVVHPSVHKCASSWDEVVNMILGDSS